MASPKKWPSTTLVDSDFKADDINKALLDLLDKDNQTWAVINQLAHPIGEVQIQLPGQDTPAKLYGGTWLNITSLYAGLFFRAEGGNALAFNAGTQNWAMAYHAHFRNAGGNSETIVLTAAGSGIGVVNGGATPLTTSVTGGITTDGAHAAPNVDVEDRPINQSIRIWKKSAN